MGFGAQAVVNLQTTPRFLKGFSAYLAAVLKTLIDYPILQLYLQVDDQAPLEQTSVMAAITNGRCFGSSFWVSPAAQADDGWLDVVIAEDLSRLSILKLIPKLMKGTHVHEPVLTMLKAKKVVLEAGAPLSVEADGEILSLEAQHLEVDILHKKVRIII